ncbi:MAG: polymer-forming cytoskeletal protein [Acidobacteriota bacterium]
MSIFRRDQDPSPRETTPPAKPASRSTENSSASRRTATGPAAHSPSAITLIAPGTRISGEIGGGTRVQVEGTLKGEIQVDAEVLVGASGQVQGNVSARSVQVAGQVKGNVSGLERVEVLASGKVEGDLAAPRVIISEGAFFKGSVEMGTQAGAAAGESTAKGRAS